MSSVKRRTRDIRKRAMRIYRAHRRAYLAPLLTAQRKANKWGMPAAWQ